MSGRHTRHCDPAGFHCQYLIDLTVSKPAMKFLPDPIQKSIIKLMMQKIVYLDDLCSDRYTFCQYLFLQFFHGYFSSLNRSSSPSKEISSSACASCTGAVSRVFRSGRSISISSKLISSAACGAGAASCGA